MANASRDFTVASAQWDSARVCRPHGEAPLLFFAPYWNATAPLPFQHPVGRAILLGKVDCTVRAFCHMFFFVQTDRADALIA